MKPIRCCLVAILLALALLLCLPTAIAQEYTTATCGLTAQATITTAAAIELAAAPAADAPVFVNPNGPPVKVASKSVVICSISMRVTQTATPSDYGLVVGTGTNCGTGQAAMTPMWKGVASSTDIWNVYYGGETPIVAPKGSAVCFKASAVTTSAQVFVTYGVRS